eukprot:CAMPEP_0118724058 /NCGR_PEP_ID=MMETSP0800-20121206/32347_1 /TAXON_ID=210618 ORGANISM="Striatella unipunctata, Strain CCMP2910" /NCGR_SAMPLE_ID=MMETSP0800 /ASSEMBLY_ACC=CAM_ASM_000638 /LENGTH=96 /DNA_ID=CAMNT_0006632551 /DNA_START=218 /DNA_END=505 /DNA_ORIENTATION=+
MLVSMIEQIVRTNHLLRLLVILSLLISRTALADSIYHSSKPSDRVKAAENNGNEFLQAQILLDLTPTKDAAAAIEDALVDGAKILDRFNLFQLNTS